MHPTPAPPPDKAAEAELVAWRNRALLAEAQLATLRAEYEPRPQEPPC